MELLRDIAHISGKSGLYKILKPGRGGVIVETLDDKKQREMVSANARVSVLKDISIYTEDQNKSIPLSDIFLKIRELHGETIADDYKSFSNNQLFDFFGQIMPDFDRQKVYPADVKKILGWYNVLSKQLPEVFTAPTTEDGSEAVTEETKAEA